MPTDFLLPDEDEAMSQQAVGQQTGQQAGQDAMPQHAVGHEAGQQAMPQQAGQALAPAPSFCRKYKGRQIRKWPHLPDPREDDIMALRLISRFAQLPPTMAAVALSADEKALLPPAARAVGLLRCLAAHSELHAPAGGHDGDGGEEEDEAGSAELVHVAAVLLQRVAAAHAEVDAAHSAAKNAEKKCQTAHTQLRDWDDEEEEEAFLAQEAVDACNALAAHGALAVALRTMSDVCLESASDALRKDLELHAAKTAATAAATAAVHADGNAGGGGGGSGGAEGEEGVEGEGGCLS
ncbi:hypothetical protein T492DRAFT_857978 [Pavlovales sp. CCMP2436]|nr:hypothetical protein T492DRAFT_857978 [Pavlovales sp. CCMP2436]